jgi:hypothetical protein
MGSNLALQDKPEVAPMPLFLYNHVAHKFVPSETCWREGQHVFTVFFTIRPAAVHHINAEVLKEQGVSTSRETLTSNNSGMAITFVRSSFRSRK